jgi:hypothetical protein
VDSPVGPEREPGQEVLDVDRLARMGRDEATIWSGSSTGAQHSEQVFARARDDG